MREDTGFQTSPKGSRAVLHRCTWPDFFTLQMATQAERGTVSHMAGRQGSGRGAQGFSAPDQRAFTSLRLLGSRVTPFQMAN